MLVPAESATVEPAADKPEPPVTLGAKVRPELAEQVRALASHRGLCVSALLGQVITDFVSGASYPFESVAPAAAAINRGHHDRD